MVPMPGALALWFANQAANTASVVILVSQVPVPPHLKHLPYDHLQFTLVDCPGHASLIRTIIGGVQIIDMVLLVVDVTKGEIAIH